MAWAGGLGGVANAARTSPPITPMSSSTQASCPFLLDAFVQVEAHAAEALVAARRRGRHHRAEMPHDVVQVVQERRYSASVRPWSSIEWIFGIASSPRRLSSVSSTNVMKNDICLDSAINRSSAATRKF